MNEQIVAKNGYSESKVEDFTKSQVETGRMTEKAASNFVENSHNNAKELEKAGILESSIKQREIHGSFAAEKKKVISK